MKSLTLLLLGMTSLCLTGCFDAETTIHLKKDGSGTVVHEVYFDEGVEVVIDSSEKEDKTESDEPETGLNLDNQHREFHAAEERKNATRMGKGVTFIGFEKLTRDKREGCRITFQFEDINTLALDPGEPVMPGIGTIEDRPMPAPSAKPITFTYKDGTLVIHSPRNDAEELKKTAAKAEDKPEGDVKVMGISPEQQKEMRDQATAKTEKDKKTLKLVIESGIASTDASFVQDKTLTLIEVDRARFSMNAAITQKVDDGTDGSFMNLPAAAEKLKGIDGVKIEPKDEIRVSVK